jgi:hypothetical protein
MLLPRVRGNDALGSHSEWRPLLTIECGASQGVACLLEVAKRRLQPASIRLIDNEQFQFGRAMAEGKHGFLEVLLDHIKTFYVTSIKGFGKTELAVVTLLFEGETEEVKVQQAAIHAIAAKHGGIVGGAENGKRGYLLTFVIAYIRDIAYDYRCVSCRPSQTRLASLFLLLLTRGSRLCGRECATPRKVVWNEPTSSPERHNPGTLPSRLRRRVHIRASRNCAATLRSGCTHSARRKACRVNRTPRVALHSSTTQGAPSISILGSCTRYGMPQPPASQCHSFVVCSTSMLTLTAQSAVWNCDLQGLADPMQSFHNVEVGAREEVLANGGNISHHHGIGKVRKQWYVSTNSPLGADMVRAVKEKVRPSPTPLSLRYLTNLRPVQHKQQLTQPYIVVGFAGGSKEHLRGRQSLRLVLLSRWMQATLALPLPSFGQYSSK